MGFQSVYEKEIQKLLRQEKRFSKKHEVKKVSALNQFLGDKVPPKLQETLEAAFGKAFRLVFEKGTSVIERTFSKKTDGNQGANLLLSGISGVGLGVLGIGIPDIVVLTGLLLKSVYEAAKKYGFDYEKEEERLFILLLIEGAISYGDSFIEAQKKIDHYIFTKEHEPGLDLQTQMAGTAKSMSDEMLYMKFLQGIPIVGAAGGMWDTVYMRQVSAYAELKYRHRYYMKRCEFLKK